MKDNKFFEDNEFRFVIKALNRLYMQLLDSLTKLK